MIEFLFWKPRLCFFNRKFIWSSQKLLSFSLSREPNLAKYRKILQWRMNIPISNTRRRSRHKSMALSQPSRHPLCFSILRRFLSLHGFNFSLLSSFHPSLSASDYLPFFRFFFSLSIFLPSHLLSTQKESLFPDCRDKPMKRYVNMCYAHVVWRPAQNN